MTIKQYDTVRLKDGRVGAVVEVFDGKAFLVDIGSSPEDWETIDATLDEIAEIIIE